MPTLPRLITHDGRTQGIEKWADETGIPVQTIRSRLDRLKWDVGRALSVRPDKRFRRGGRRVEGFRPVPIARKNGKGKSYARWRDGTATRERQFGDWGSPEAAEAYRRFSAEWATGAHLSKSTGQESADGVSVSRLAARFAEHAKEEYRKDGKITSEYYLISSACDSLEELYGDTLAADFTPANLRAVQVSLIAKQLARGTVNAYVARIVRAFSWGVSRGLVVAATANALEHVEKVKSGRTLAVEKAKRQPVTDAQVAATLPHLSAVPARAAKLRAMIEIQRLTGMRPGEICALRPADLDRTADVWRYTVGAANKNRHRGKAQRYYLGPKARGILEPFLTGEASRPVFPIARNAYTREVTAACVKAGCVPWTPHQLRHALATEVAERFRSMGYAAAAIGDNAATAEAVYVHVDPQERAKIEIAKAMG